VRSPESTRSGVTQTSPGARGGIMFAQRCVVVGIMLTTLGGCVALEVGPDRVYPVDDQVADIRSYEADIRAYEIDHKLSPAVLTDVTARNNFITERMYAMDLEYSQYFSRLTNQLALGNLSLDVVNIALGAAGTAFASSVTKTALSATSTVISGARTSIDKDVLVANTIQILQSTMESSRNHIRARIEGNLQYCLVAEYTVWQAMTELEDYYRAGTIPGALEALAAAAGNNSQTSKDVKNGSTQTSTPAPATGQGQTSNGAPVRTLAAAPQQQNGNTSPKCQASAEIKSAARFTAARANAAAAAAAMRPR